MPTVGAASSPPLILLSTFKEANNLALVKDEEGWMNALTTDELIVVQEEASIKMKRLEITNFTQRMDDMYSDFFEIKYSIILIFHMNNYPYNINNSSNNDRF